MNSQKQVTNRIQEFLIQNKDFRLSDVDADNTFGQNREELENELEKMKSLLTDLQYKLYIENKNALLIVLQGMDTSGKDGTIRHVISGFNPQSCNVVSFKTPTREELEHDFLWRIHKAVPRNGNISVFNRSHYEDVVEARVQKLKSKSTILKRYDHINYFEKVLSDNGVIIIKFFLHISKDEQKKRLDERASDPKKRWKIDDRDFERRKQWKEYSKAYTEAMVRCGVNHLPWYVIPSNKKWFRNWIIAKVICSTLQDYEHGPKMQSC